MWNFVALTSKTFTLITVGIFAALDVSNNFSASTGHALLAIANGTSTFGRLHVMDVTLRDFLRQPSEKRKVIVNLGCGRWGFPSVSLSFSLTHTYTPTPTHLLPLSHSCSPGCGDPTLAAPSPHTDTRG